MNKKILVLSMAMAFSSLAGVCHAAEEGFSQDILLTGKVQAAIGCKVDAAPSVTFDNVELTDIGTVESGKPYKNNPGAVYDIWLTECSKGETVSVTVMGSASDENSDLIALDDVVGSAQHVGVSFWDEGLTEKRLIAANSGSSNVHSTNSDGTVHIPIYVAPTQTSASQVVVPGTISATTNIKVNFL